MERLRWMLRPAPRLNAAVRLFWCHHAAGSATIYQAAHARFPKSWDVCFLEAPGRGGNAAEPPAASLAALADYFAARLRPFLDAPVALFGHSMGAWTAYEIARRLEAGGTTPAWLGASGRKAPQLASPERERGLHRASDEALTEHLRKLGGTPDEIFAMPEMLEYVLEVVRADYRLVEMYEHAQGRRLACPVAAFGGDADPWVSRDDLDAWRHATSGAFALRMWAGGHFYLYDAQEAVCRAVVDAVQPLLPSA